MDTDCKRIEEHFKPPTVGETGDMRLSIDLCRLRQDIWTNGTDEVEIHSHAYVVIESDGSIHNVPTYIRAKILRTSSYDVTPDPESTIKKVKKQLARARTNAIPSG
eukprot:6446520-Pyramimonas_sp.AAC.1